MIVQACLNGSRPDDYHPRLPTTPHSLAMDGVACISAGAAELHVHPRGADGRESLLAVDETIDVLRRSCPGSLIGVSTGAWIEGDETRTRSCISTWKNLPDYASVNLSEPDAPAVMALLNRMDVGVEAGLATVSDAERFIALPECQRSFRVLIEIEEQDIATADVIVDEIVKILARAGVRRPMLLHGFDATVWHFVARASQCRWSTRIGLEDGRQLRNGQKAAGNAELVAAAVEIYRMNAR